MKHNYYPIALWLIAAFCPAHIRAQTQDEICGNPYWFKKGLEDPENFQKHQDYEALMLGLFERPAGVSRGPEITRTLPVVVHIIHDEGDENLSDDAVTQAISWLNLAFANQDVFDKGSGVNCGIQFCLAQRTPGGQITNGITRNQSALTEMKMESQDLLLKNINRWNPKEYINIWLVRSICSDGYGCGVYGYSNYPYAHGSSVDGIVFEAAYFTSIKKVTGLAHEMGHFLGLYHTFEGGCSNNDCLLDGDRICDTPPDQSTSGVPCDNAVNTCSTDSDSGPFTTDQVDMSQNYLDYGIIACFHDFTQDQSTRMNATLDGIRNSLLESKACLPPCATTSKFSVTICANTTYKYRNVLLPADTLAFFTIPNTVGCDSIIQVNVYAYPPLSVKLPEDTTIAVGASVLLRAKPTGTGNLKFAWSPTAGLSCTKCPDPVATPQDTVTYTLLVTDHRACTAVDKTSINILEDCRLRIPTAFTPNGDGANDRFAPLMDPCVKTVKLWRILNRWGQVVFEQVNLAANDPELGWDGVSNGIAQASELLIWVGEFEYFDGRSTVKTGEITLLR